jgi:hypothetical protein
MILKMTSYVSCWASMKGIVKLNKVVRCFVGMSGLQIVKKQKLPFT